MVWVRDRSTLKTPWDQELLHGFYISFYVFLQLSLDLEFLHFGVASKFLAMQFPHFPHLFVGEIIPCLLSLGGFNLHPFLGVVC